MTEADHLLRDFTSKIYNLGEKDLTHRDYDIRITGITYSVIERPKNRDGEMSLHGNEQFITCHKNDQGQVVCPKKPK